MSHQRPGADELLGRDTDAALFAAGLLIAGLPQARAAMRRGRHIVAARGTFDF